MKTQKTSTIRILKRHIGRPVDFLGCNASAGAILNGRIEAVRNGMVSIRFYVARDCDGNQVACSDEGCVACLAVRDPRLVAVY